MTEPQAMNTIGDQQEIQMFLTNNPASSIEEIAGIGLCVKNPWGDPSIALKVPENPGLLYEALNNLYLPDQYSLIYHLDTSEIEVIFTSLKLSPVYDELKARKFDFIFEGVTYPCLYGPSSTRLLEIARHHVTLSQSPTQSRNLSSYNQALDIEEAPDFIKSLFGEPISFWIKNVTWSNSDSVQTLIKNLNFFMAYFDTSTPRVLIHSLNGGSAILPQNTRYPFDSFPNEIIAHRIDDNLYQFWDATLSGDSIRKFLYNFQILEYAAVYYLDEDNKRAIRKLLITPDASSRMDSIIQSIIETLGSVKLYDSQKMEALLKKSVDGNIIWNEIQRRVEIFSTDMDFEGGFVSKALLKKSTKFDEFEINWAATFCNRIRDIRNALSHGKETRSGSVIFPSILNQDKLQVWLPLVSAAAKQVILNKNVV